MEKLTNEQMAWALEWSAMHLIEHDTQTKAAEELTHCAKHFRIAADKERAGSHIKQHECRYEDYTIIAIDLKEGGCNNEFK